MARTIFPLPENDPSNGWSALLPPRTPRAALAQDLHVDWLVIGAGYAGLAAARRLAQAQPHASIAIVEAGIVGENASGRNSGFGTDLPRATQVTPAIIEQGKRTIRLNRFALQSLDHLVQTHAIACDWQPGGRYHVAVSPAIAEHDLGAYAQNLEAWGVPFTWYKRLDLHERLGTPYYSAGIYTPGTYLMNPAALVRGLADSLPEQIQLFEQSPVIQAQLDGTQPWIRTEQGRIQARGVILAVNAFSQAFGVYTQQQVPILLFAGLSPPLTTAQRTHMGINPSWGATPTRMVGSTLRLTADGRLMIRQGFEYSPKLRATHTDRTQARALSLKLLRQRFSQFAHLDIEHFWMGWIAVSRNYASAAGQIGDKAWAISCCNGSGIARHTAAGMLIADLATQHENPLMTDFLAQTQASVIPPRPLRDWGVKLTLLRARWQGRFER